MWYDYPRRKSFPPILSQRLLEVTTGAYVVAQAGGITSSGPERGRQFEQLFYKLCQCRGLRLSERAGAKTMGGQSSASGFWHEVDAVSRSVASITHWELKYLTAVLEKNELLIFNGKGLDFLRGTNAQMATTPVQRFLLSGSNLRDEGRCFAVQWGIVTIEPKMLPMPLIYEAVARGAGDALRPAECEAVRRIAAWACRPLQQVVRELWAWCSGEEAALTNGSLTRRAKEALDLQEQIGSDVLDYIDEQLPDWQDQLLDQIWREIGGW